MSSKLTRLDRLAVLAGARTPQAKSFGALADITAVALGMHATEMALAKAKLAPKDVDELVIGNVASPPDSANIARVIALGSQIPPERIAHTVNRNCASGMEAIIGGWLAIQTGRAEIVVAGGTESMSRIPLLFSEAAKQKLLAAGRSKSLMQRIRAYARLRMSDLKPVLGVELGLTDPSCGMNMGETAELLAEEFAITRDAQDAFALNSHRKAVAAGNRCFLSGEIAPLIVNGQELRLDVGPRAQQSLAQLARLEPIFRRDGTVTAGNSCPLTDGATSLVICREGYLGAKHAAKPLGFVSDYAIAGCDPRRMGLGPVYATAKLLKQTGLKLGDFDLIEINEAFAAQVLACVKASASKSFATERLGLNAALGEIDPEKLNINGGAIALGHPVGTSGARLVLTLLRALRERGLKRGLATLCVGGGQGYAMMVESE